MALTDMLLPIETYPDPPPDAAIEQAVGFAAAVGGGLSALALEVEFRNPSNWLADRLIGLGGMVAEEERRSQEASARALEVFSRAAAAARVSGEALRRRSELYRFGERAAEAALTRDLSLVPVPCAEPGDSPLALVEALIFGSGRPVLLFSPEGGANLPREPARVVIAWDASRSAARALSDSLPLLERARQVRVLTVLNDKQEDLAGSGQAVVRHLAVHGVVAEAAEVDLDRRPVGRVLADYAVAHGDLLVMGAYGHSRTREFVLGGATAHMLPAPPLPLFVAH